MQQQRNRFGASKPGEAWLMRRLKPQKRRRAHVPCLQTPKSWKPACTLALALVACRICASRRAAAVCVQPTFRAPTHASRGTHLNQFRSAAATASRRARNACFSLRSSRRTLSARPAGPSNQGVASKPRRVGRSARPRKLYRFETKRPTFQDRDPRPALLRRATARFRVRWHAPR